MTFQVSAKIFVQFINLPSLCQNIYLDYWLNGSLSKHSISLWLSQPMSEFLFSLWLTGSLSTHLFSLWLYDRISVIIIFFTLRLTESLSEYLFSSWLTRSLYTYLFSFLTYRISVTGSSTTAWPALQVSLLSYLTEIIK